MFDYDAIKQLAKDIKRPIVELYALDGNTDPFMAGYPYRLKEAEWFVPIWNEYGDVGGHLRRIHYKIVSQRIPLLMPDGKKYENTLDCWKTLCRGSLGARYLDLVPFDGLVDRRNDEPMFFAPFTHLDPDEDREVSAEVNFSWVGFANPEFPLLPETNIDGLDPDEVRQDYVVEVWIEKSTQNDWLVPLCKRRGVNLVVGAGESSETRCRELAFRASEYAKPARVIYISDFDPGGRSMPKAVARKVEFTLYKHDLDVDLQLIPLALTPDQCRRFRLPRTPIKDTEKRKDKFEQTFGVGATELDAMEALHPGELGRLLDEELDNFLDADLGQRIRRAYHNELLPLNLIEADVRAAHAEEISDIEERFAEIVEELEALKSEAGDLWQTMADEMEEELPDLSGVEIPRSDAPGETDTFVLFDSTRDYLTQMDFYNQWKEGEEDSV